MLSEMKINAEQCCERNAQTKPVQNAQNIRNNKLIWLEQNVPSS